MTRLLREFLQMVVCLIGRTVFLMNGIKQSIYCSDLGAFYDIK